jgi:5'-nucleotidase/UDP-sugar diphosphatase
MRFLSLILLLPLFGLPCTPGPNRGPLSKEQAKNKDMERKVIILHTNDLHGHLAPWTGWEGPLKGKQVGGLGRLAGAIREIRKDHPDNVLLLDAGDLLGDTMIADLTKGEVMITALNFLQYDAMAIGNHEPDFTADILKQRIAQAKFPAVAANLFTRKDGTLFTKPYFIKKIGGIAVGVLGVAYPNTAKTTATKNVTDLEFQEPIAAVKQNLPKMRDEGAELILVLSHLGLGGDKHLARSIAGIDVIVGGHSHNRMDEAEKVGSTLIVQAGAHGSDLGRLDLTMQEGKITAHRRTLIPLTHDKVPTDPSAEELQKKLFAPYQKGLDEVVGQAKDWLARAQTLAGQNARKRDEESPIDSLFADILRSETKSDIAILPGVGYGVAIPPGPITAAQLRQMIPHDGKAVTMCLSGAQVIEVLEQAVENTYSDDPKVKVGGMVQVSGIRFSYDPIQAKGQRVWHVERVEGQWDAKAAYTIVTNSMLAAGGHNYQTLTKGENRTELGSQYEIVRNWITRHSPVSSPPSGRITKMAKLATK